MRIILILLFAFGTMQATAQNKINSYQYWFDGLYNNAVSQSILPTATYTLATQINTNSLLNGLHLFNIKFKDDSSRFSNTLSTFFYKTFPTTGTHTISSYQYWFDDNFINAVSQTATNNTDFTFTDNVSALNLLNGLHVIHVRFKDNANRWSETLSQFFYKAAAAGGSSNNINAYQYWFDQNFAAAVQQNITPGALYTLSAPINASNLLNGIHVLNVRFLDGSNKWSSTCSQFFYKAAAITANNLTKFQYWFDQNFLGAVEQNISPSATYNLSDQISTNALLYGLHAISTRFMDMKGKWSSTSTQFFYKEKPASVNDNKIAAYRYWFDERDSILNLVAIAPFMNPLILNQPIAADGIDSGQHVIHFQFLDLNGKWSMVTTDTATVIAKATYTFNGNGNWSNANNWVNKIKPPLHVTGTYKIFIDPIASGQCILDVSQQITEGAIFTIRSGKTFLIPGNLNITQ
jgi:hypothetical protein